MKQIGSVVEIKGNIAKIEVDRKSACDMCENAANCVEKCKKVYATAQNLVNAEVGDTVEIETETHRILINSVIVFLFPIFFAIAAYFLSDLFFAENVSVLITFFVLVFSMFAFCFGLNKLSKKRVISKIVRVL